jgi:hypothetical protein
MDGWMDGGWEMNDGAIITKSSIKPFTIRCNLKWHFSNDVNPPHLELYGYQPGQYCQPTWNSVRTNRANTANPLGILCVPTGPILPPTWNSVGTNRIYTANPLGILWVPTGSILPTHWELYGYQPDQYCRVHNQESSLEANGPTRGPLGDDVGPTFHKAPSKALSKDLPKSLLV